MNTVNYIRFDNSLGKWTTHYGISTPVSRLIETDKMNGDANVEYHHFNTYENREALLKTLIKKFQTDNNIVFKFKAA